MTFEITKMTRDEWIGKARQLFGNSSLDWRFRCPVCGYEAAVSDWIKSGAPAGSEGFSCIGRWIKGSREAFESKGPGPCNYAGGGIFRLNPVHVTNEDGTVSEMFAFADGADVIAPSSP